MMPPGMPSSPMPSMPSDMPLASDADSGLPGAVSQKVQSLSPLPRNIVWLLGLGGVILVIAGVMFPQYRKQLVIAGAALILGAVFFWVLLFVLAMIANKRSGGWRGGSGGGGFGGGYSGGGFGGGGFSGGGGASGSW